MADDRIAIQTLGLTGRLFFELYGLRWKDGTEINQYSFYTMVPMNLERAAEQDDVRSLQYWMEGLSNPMTLKTFYQQGIKSE